MDDKLARIYTDTFWKSLRRFFRDFFSSIRIIIQYQPRPVRRKRR